MYRTLYKDLLEWKDSNDRKPLVLFGARQTGKTWLLKEFGTNEYSNVAYINCDNNPVMGNAFIDYDTERLIRVFSAVSNERIEKDKTLIVLDEVQEIPAALTSLKYFCEQEPEYHIAVAGSLLGLSVHSGSGYPVGKTDELIIYPMSFKEFMMAGGYDVLLNNLETHEWDEMNTYKDKFIEFLRQYYFTGGMPEVVEYYFRTKDIHGTRNIQNRILNDYDQDFSKHIPAATLAKVRLVYNSIPSQLAKENKKFIYGAIKKGGRAKEFEDAIQWLVNAGLIYRVARIKKIEMPVKFYEEYESFKLFLSDLGLLGAMSNVPASQILVGDNVFSEYKGAFTEQYVAQQIKTEGIVPYYYTNANSTMEIDFVIQKEEVHPIEVKAEENLRSKSLKTVIENNPELTGWRFSMSGYRNQDWLINIPLPLIQEWIKAAK